MGLDKRHISDLLINSGDHHGSVLIKVVLSPVLWRHGDSVNVLGEAEVGRVG